MRLVLEAHAGPGGLKALVKGAVIGGKRADALLERGVLGGDALDGLLGPFGFQVADLAEELADAGALGGDLGVSGPEGVLGVQRPFPPCCLALVVLAGEHLDPLLAGLGHGDSDPGVRIAVEEGAGHVIARRHDERREQVKTVGILRAVQHPTCTPSPAAWTWTARPPPRRLPFRITTAAPRESTQKDQDDQAPDVRTRRIRHRILLG
jgi:hypothetical protein